MYVYLDKYRLMGKIDRCMDVYHSLNYLLTIYIIFFQVSKRAIGLSRNLLSFNQLNVVYFTELKKTLES